MNLLTFNKRKDPNGRELRKRNKYYKEPLNNQLYNSNSGGNCVWYAYGRFLEVWSGASSIQKSTHKWPGSFSSNGNGMVRAAREKGFKTGSTPKPGAIVSWSGPSSAGHVAFVEDVHLDKNGKIISIEVSQSSYTYGDMTNVTLKPPYNQLYGKCLGFAYNPITFAGSNGYVKDYGNDTAGTSGIDFAKRISTLISSDNYEFISKEKEQEDEKQQLYETVGNTISQKFKSAISEINNTLFNKGTKAGTLVSDKIINNLKTTVKPVIDTVTKTKATFSIANNLVESPFIELNIGGITIGGYGNSLDQYPNYVQELTVQRTNGVINQYKINFIYQIRPGEDPNLLDEVLSKNRFNPIQIKYGDSSSVGYFIDKKAIITNVMCNRNYSSMSISYTLEATSAGSLVKTYTLNMPTIIDKPSNVIRDLLYNNYETSKILLDAFPGMRNRTLVDSKGLIPNNDAVLDIDAQYNVNLIQYLGYLVGSMSNEKSGNEIIRNSLYGISYNDADELIPDGAYFKIKEIQADVDPYAVTDKVFELTIGYPFDDIILDFNVESTNSWELLYNNRSNSTEYVYTILNNGDINKYYSPGLSSSSEILSEINKNWWTNMIKFPVSATVILKGLLKPVMLMDYIKINVVFYGQPHILSGTYAITGQTDSLTSSGFRTSLSLVRVGE